MFSNHAASFSFLSKAFTGDYLRTAQTMSKIDLLIVSYNYYDHLDFVTLEALMSKIRRMIMPLGMGLHLCYWGARSEIIEEQDWNQSVRVTDSLVVHVLPARRFSGRNIKRSQTLWVSFMSETPKQNVYYGGDSGYGPHFKAIGEQFGSVDLAAMESGQCDQDWKFIHMMPGETAQVAADLRAKAMLPGYADHFVLAKRTWGDPYKRLALASCCQGCQLLTPMLGKPVMLSEPNQPFTTWW